MTLKGVTRGIARRIRPSVVVAPEVVTWAAAVVSAGGTVSPARQIVVSNLVTSLKSAAVWTELDRLWLLAAENTQSALLDIVGLVTATVPVPPTFTVDRGYKGNATTQYINAGFNPVTAPSPKYVRDNASFGYWEVLTDNLGSSMAMGNTNSTTRITCGFNGANHGFEINSSTGATPSGGASATGFFHAQRTASTVSTLFRNGTSYLGNAAASNVVQNFVFFVGSGNSAGAPTGFSGCQIGCAFIGSSMAGKEVAFYNALRTYMTAVGVP